MLLTQADTDMLMRVAHWSNSHDLYEIVRAHVEGYTCTTPNVRVTDVQLTMNNGTKHRRFVLGTVSAVHVKLSNSALVTVQVETTYRATASFTLAGNMKKRQAAEDNWHVYVVRCNDGSLYCGTTNNVERRVREHNESHKGAKYTRARRPVTLVKSWKAGTRSDAVKAECRFKKLSRAKKEDVCS
jgi:putative endonuclease